MIFSKHARAALLAAVLFAAETAAAQAAREALQPRGSHDLRISDKARAVLVEVSQTAKGRMKVATADSEMTRAVDFVSKARWMDEVGAPGGSATHHRRTFIEFQIEDCGKIRDPGIEGVCLEISLVDGVPGVHVRSPRRILKSEIAKQGDLAHAVGLQVELPASAAVGASFRFQGQALVATILDVEAELENFESKLTLDRVDDATQHANLSGPVAFDCKFEKVGVQIAGRYEGRITIEVDLESHEMVEVVLTGASMMSGRGRYEGRLSGNVGFQCRATATKVANPNAHRVKKPAFRTNTHAFAGVLFDLPSCWMPIPPREPGTKLFVDSRSDTAGYIELKVGEDQGDPSDQEFIDGFLDVVRREAADAKGKKASFKSGDGMTFELTADDRSKVRGFVVRAGGRIVRGRLVGSAEALRKSDSEFRELRDSLVEDPDR